MFQKITSELLKKIKKFNNSIVLQKNSNKSSCEMMILNKGT